MKQFVILCVALTMLVKPLWPVAEYVMNYDYIVSVLCENKGRPELQCDGKCYLSKQLAKEAQEHEKNPFEKQSKVEIQQIVFLEKPFPLDFDFISDGIQKNNFSTSQKFILRLFTSDISQPPELA